MSQADIESGNANVTYTGGGDTDAAAPNSEDEWMRSDTVMAKLYRHAKAEADATPEPDIIGDDFRD